MKGVKSVTIKEIILGGGGGLVLLLTLIQITPIKLNPWTALAKAIGRAINADVLDELKDVRSRLDDHIQMDAEGKADERRTRILRFNNELIRKIPHTKEEFVDIMVDIDVYEAFCRENPYYKNNRASHAIDNIGRVYDERMKQHDFLT